MKYNPFISSYLLVKMWSLNASLVVYFQWLQNSFCYPSLLLIQMHWLSSTKKVLTLSADKSNLEPNPAQDPFGMSTDHA